MSWKLQRRASAALGLMLASAVVLPLVASGGGSGVTTSTDPRSFVVQGTTALGIVRYMNSHAFEGDSGRAYANMHPTYSLSLTTRQRGPMCVPAQLGVHIDLDLTLPVAANPGAMSRSTRAAWNNFVGFARAHENHHKVHYIGCATAWIAEERSESASSCMVLRSTLEHGLAAMGRACEASEQPYERSQAQILPRISLFAMARMQSFQ